VRLRECLGSRERRLEPAALLRADATLEVARVNAQPRGEPRERLSRRPGLAALDLADVLLREAAAGEVGLGQAGGDATLAYTLA
jgi:hypothetical protein